MRGFAKAEVWAPANEPCCPQCPQADLEPPAASRREAQAAAQAQAAGAAVPRALRLRRAGHRRAQLQRQRRHRHPQGRYGHRAVAWALPLEGHGHRELGQDPLSQPTSPSLVGLADFQYGPGGREASTPVQPLHSRTCQTQTKDLGTAELCILSETVILALALEENQPKSQL